MMTACAMDIYTNTWTGRRVWLKTRPWVNPGYQNKGNPGNTKHTWCLCVCYLYGNGVCVFQIKWKSKYFAGHQYLRISWLFARWVFFNIGSFLDFKIWFQDLSWVKCLFEKSIGLHFHYVKNPMIFFYNLFFDIVKM